MACAADEAEFTIESNPVHKFNTGSWNAVDNPDNAWKNNFTGIYAANLFLQNSDSINLDYYKYDAAKQREYEQALSYIKRWKQEARFLRAFFYFELIKRYGGVPLIDKPLNLTSDYTQIPRSPLSECVRFILDECDSIKGGLPLNYMERDTVENKNIQGQNFGRATQGAVLALKSRVLLYAASDLFNSPDQWAPGYEHPEWISMTDAKTREERWIEAAEAAYEVIKLNEYNLSPSKDGDQYGGLFRTFENQEIIFAQRNGSSNYFETINYPIGFNGKSGATPLGNLVDDYEIRQTTQSAIPFDWNNPEHAANPFNKRDSRLAATILKNNDWFNGGKERAIETWTGGADGKGVSGAGKTGYYLNKYIDPSRNLLLGESSIHTWILFRYAEILLNYAEAVNEAYGPTESLPGANLTPNEALSDIRKRVAMPEFRTKATMITDPQKMTTVIRHERRVELAFEDFRFWDVRRWMIAPETLGVPARGLEVTKLSDGTFSYQPVVIENRVWANKMYLYPIPQKELKIADGWLQNPLW
jgi:hypothetical protein